MIFLLSVLAMWALMDIYTCYRMIRKPEIDWTAGVMWYWALKWSFASQTKLMVEKLPWLSQDLTEALNIRDDDGEIT